MAGLRTRAECEERRTEAFREALRCEEGLTIWALNFVLLTVCAVACVVAERPVFPPEIVCALAGVCAGGAWCSWRERRHWMARGRALFEEGLRAEEVQGREGVHSQGKQGL